MVSITPPPLSELVDQLIETTAPDAQTLFDRGEEAVKAIDTEAIGIWLQIVRRLTGKENAGQGMMEVTEIVPTAFQHVMRETQIACAALHASMQTYFQSQMAAIMRQPVVVSPEENRKHTVIGIKGMHGNALAVREYLQSQRSKREE